MARQALRDGAEGVVIVIRRVDGQDGDFFRDLQEGDRITDGPATLRRWFPCNKNAPSDTLDRLFVGNHKNRRTGHHWQVIGKVQAKLVFERLFMGLADDNKVREGGVFHQQIQMVASFAKIFGRRLIGLAAIGKFLLDILGCRTGNFCFLCEITKGRAAPGDGVWHMGRLFRVEADKMGVESLGKLYGRFDPRPVLWVVGKMYEDCLDWHD